MPLSRQSLAPPLFLLAASALVFAYYGFDRGLWRDTALILYTGQRMAEGVPPYVSGFINTGPLSLLLSGLGAGLAAFLGLDQIYTVRFLFFIISILGVLSMYLLTKELLASERAGVLAGLLMLGFYEFAWQAASGPSYKSPLILFQNFAFLFTIRRKWFWAGVVGSLAALTWQPAALLLLVALIPAILSPPKKRLPALLQLLVGAAIPVLFFAAYFISQSALDDLVQQALLYNFQYFPSWLRNPLIVLFRGYPTTWPLILLALFIFPYILVTRRSLHPSRRDFLASNPWAFLFLSTLAYSAWSLYLFNEPTDFYVFFPPIFASLSYFFDQALAHTATIVSPRLADVLPAILGLSLILLGLFTAEQKSESLLAWQRERAQRIEDRFGNNFKLLAIGLPEVLVLLNKPNPTPYLFLDYEADRWIADHTPGGFGGWISQLEAYRPDIVVFREERGQFVPQLVSWLESHYHSEQIGAWPIFVRN